MSTTPKQLRIINGIPAVQHTPQTLTEEQKAQARENIGFTTDDALVMAAEMNLIDPLTDENGAFLVDENGNILVG